MSRLEWRGGERPEYAFCESVHALPLGRWHIRRVGEAGLKLGGGIDTASLCGRVRPYGVGSAGGWDLNVRILPHHFTAIPPVCCSMCAEEYARIGRAGEKQETG